MSITIRTIDPSETGAWYETLMTAFGALGLLSLKFGVDSRRDERNL